MASQPEITIIIPIYHASQLVADTCESLLLQEGCSWEAIFIDAGLELQASDIIKSYQDSRIRVQALTKASLYALMNRGLLMARGEYVNLLLEGCTYLANTSLAEALRKIREYNNPDLFYTASYVGDEQGVRHLYYVSDWQNSIKSGLQPALLQSCFFKSSLFKRIGYFYQDLDRRGALEFFCRVHKDKGCHVASAMRVYVEMNRFPIELLGSWLIFNETVSVIYSYFGIQAALLWIFSTRLKVLFQRACPLEIIIQEVK